MLALSPFVKLTRAVRRELEEEAERLLRFVEPEATRYAVTRTPAA